MILNALAKGEPLAFEPKTREEKFLAQQALRESQGGSAAGGSVEPLILEEFDNKLIDVTDEEIIEAVNSGRPVFLRYGGTDYSLMSCYIGEGVELAFMGINDWYSDLFYVIRVNYGQVEVKIYQLTKWEE